ncbi:hypothetical protein GCM10010435_27880 [Winogradskya consettensis]
MPSVEPYPWVIDAPRGRSTTGSDADAGVIPAATATTPSNPAATHRPVRTVFFLAPLRKQPGEAYH